MASTPDRLHVPRSARRAGQSALALALGVLAAFPLLWMVSIALRSQGAGGITDLLPSDPTLDNFAYLLTRFPFPRYIVNSLFVSATITVVALLFHSMAAYALARLRFPGREAVFMSIFATLLVALPVILVPLFIIVRELGMTNSYAGLIVPVTFNAFGIFLLRQFYLGIPRELEEAAALDGAGYWRIYWHVILPLSRPILGALTVFFFLANWNSFLWPVTITRDQSLWVVQIAISTFHSQYGAEWGYVMAASTIAALPTILLFLLFQRRIVESIKTSGFR